MPLHATGRNIFINYQKDDSSWNALALHNELLKHFPANQIYKDFIVSFPGEDMATSIRHTLDQCHVLLVLIGRQWLTTTNVRGTYRISDPTDPVHIEIATALERNILVVPVLFDGTPMPQAAALPPALARLSTYRAAVIDNSNFAADVQQLAAAIRRASLSTQEQPQANYNTTTHTTHKTPTSNTTGAGNFGSSARPDNNLVWGILTLVLCCSPLGIVSIIYASNANDYYKAGKYELAQEHADKARKWAIYGAIASVVLGIIMALISKNNHADFTRY